MSMTGNLMWDPAEEAKLLQNGINDPAYPQTGLDL